MYHATLNHINNTLLDTWNNTIILETQVVVGYSCGGLTRPCINCIYYGTCAYSVQNIWIDVVHLFSTWICCICNEVIYTMSIAHIAVQASGPTLYRFWTHDKKAYILLNITHCEFSNSILEWNKIYKSHFFFFL